MFLYNQLKIYQNLTCRLFSIIVGTRYFIRGLDVEGNAANYVETEQIAQFETGACSFVQVTAFLRATSVFTSAFLA